MKFVSILSLSVIEFYFPEISTGLLTAEPKNISSKQSLMKRLEVSDTLKLTHALYLIIRFW